MNKNHILAVQKNNHESVFSEEQFIQIKNILQHKYQTPISNDDVYVILGFLQNYGLSVYSHDLHIIPSGDGNKIVISIEGLRKMAKKHGITNVHFEYYYRGLGFADFPINGKQDLIGIRATYQDSQKSYIVNASMSEYYCEQNEWKLHPITLLENSAESKLYNKLLPIYSAYSEEEWDMNHIVKKIIEND